jgi:purine-binding chemotaxis protein CheW
MIQEMELGMKTNGLETDETQLVTFSLDNEEFGVPIAFVKEIVRIPEITRIPRAPSFVEGVANLRGNILPIINLRLRFGLKETERDDDNRAVVIEIDGKLTGLMVDRVSEVMQVSRESVEPPPEVVASNVDSAYLSGIAKLDHGKRLVLLLDINRVIPSVELEAAYQQAGQAGEKQQEAVRQVVEEEQLVTFQSAGEEYAIEIMNVQEIIRVAEISRVPRAPDFIEGVVALRNQLLPIVNLRKRFGLTDVVLDDDSRVIVVKLGGVITGLQVDAVSEVLSVPKAAFETPPSILNAEEASQLKGVVKLEEGKRLIMLLDINHVLSTTEIRQLKALNSKSDGKNEAKKIEEKTARKAIDEEQFVSFRVENEEFGVNIQQVQEIIWLPEITRVPHAPYYVEGIVNLRGNVLPVIDIRKRFSMPVVKATDSTSIVVVDIEGHKTGMIVDTVSEVLRINKESIEAPPAVVTGVDASFIKGIGKLNNGLRMLIILDLGRVLVEQGIRPV